MHKLILRALIFIGPIMGFGQFCERVEAITDTDALFEVKKLQIDSLLVNAKENNLPELADLYHCIGLKLYHNAYVNCKNSGKEVEFCKEFLENAIGYTQKALVIKESTDSVKVNSLIRTLYNLGYLHNVQGSLYSSIGYFEKLVQLGEHDLKTRSTLLKLARLYMSMGDFHKAIEKYDQTTTYALEGDALDENQIDFLVETYLRKANVYSLMGYKEYAAEIQGSLQKADSIMQLSTDENIDFINERLRMEQIKGNLFLENGEFDEALPYNQSVVSNLTTAAPLALAIANNSLGSTQLKLKKHDQALKSFHKALALDSLYTDPYNNLGDLYFAEKKFKIGMFNYQKAIMYSINPQNGINYNENPTIEDLSPAPNKLTLLIHIVTKANAWLNYYKSDDNKEHLTKALETFALADKLVDIIRSESTEFQSKLYWRQQSSNLFMKAVEVCYLLDQPYEAYYFMERNKALLLLEDLNTEDAKQIAKMPNAKAQQEFDLKRAIFLSENELRENTGHFNNDSVALLKQTVRKHKYNYEKFIDSLEITYPDYAKFKKKVDVLTFENLKANYIAQNKATLHYILNDEDGYGLLTTADTTELFRLDSIPNLNGDVEQLIAALSNGLSDMANFKNISNRVFKSLFPKNVYNKIKGKQLTIIPDYTLQQIPFETLVVDNNELNYLFQDVEIAYAYSVSLLDHTQKGHKEFNTDFLGVAPILFDSLQLSELYFSENEVRSIAGIFSGETLLSGQASKKNFIDHANTHSILHLATHADIGDGDNPWIAFNDSKMYLKEIYATKNAADMVVLSACNTSSGELKRGEGVMSLARGFFYSGAKSVVSTLWPVADESGKDILIDFYKNLDQGLTKSKALQQAKHDYLKNTLEEELKHPYYWAGFVVLGDNAPLSDKPISPWLLLVLGILGAAIIVFGYKKIKAHQAAA